mgnify:CR=1 FL=1
MEDTHREQQIKSNQDYGLNPYYNGRYSWSYEDVKQYLIKE